MRGGRRAGRAGRGAAAVATVLAVVALAVASGPVAVPPAGAAVPSVWLWTTDDAPTAVGVAGRGATRAPAASAVAPDRFVAQLATEALGRAPSQAEWAAYRAGLAGKRCDRSFLATLATRTLLGAELARAGYSPAERALVTHRALLARDPSDAELHAAITTAGRPGRGWPAVVGSVTGSAEFAALAGRICNPTVRDVGWRAAPPVALPGAVERTQASVQADLRAAAAAAAAGGGGGGGVVELAPGTVVRVTDPPLLVPPGVTLRTAGLPGPGRYARMARLVRDELLGDDFDDLMVRPVVKVFGGAALTNVWVDGQRGRAGRRFGSFNVMVLPGTGTVVADNRLDNVAGATNLQSNGTADGATCRDNRITGNLVQAFASNHSPVLASTTHPWGGWTDGISLHCEDATVSGNTVVDASDVGIIVFADGPAGTGGVAQRSAVRGNTVVNTGHAAYAALAADALMPREETAKLRELPDAPDAPSRSFEGTSVTGNLVWTGSRAHFHFVLAVGTGAWFGSAGFVGRGAAFTGNTTGTGTARAGVGVVVANMRNARIAANTLRLVPVTATACPSAAVVVTPDADADVDTPVDVRGNGDLRACLDPPSS